MNKKSTLLAAALISTSCAMMQCTSVAEKAAYPYKAKAEINMPIIQTKYTADPAPIVVNDTVYLYTSHDEDNGEGFIMKNWLLYTSTDMVNWHDRGIVASLRDLKWYNGDNGAWAIQVAHRNGKWYMYCPVPNHGIGVLVADKPTGPFVDAIGKPLIPCTDYWGVIDPTVLIDDDGQAYLYWGNPECYCAKLNDDMISIKGEITRLPHIKDYQEGPWAWKRNGHYYLAFASTCCPEGIGYAMAKTPMGPWEYKGHIMDHTERTRGNHPGIIDYKGKSFCFGQNYDVFRLENDRHAERRSVSLSEMEYNADGTIRELPYFHECPLNQVEYFNPYRRVEAETMAWGFGLKTGNQNPCSVHNSLFVRSIDDGEFIRLKGVDFGKGASSFKASVSCHLYGGEIEIHLDDEEGQLIGTLSVDNTKTTYQTLETKVKAVGGVHDLYLVFRGCKQQKQNLFLFDWWEFTQS